MKTSLIVAAVAAALSSVVYVPAARAQSASELAQLKAQLEALQAKVAEMEKAQKAQTETQDKTLDMIAQQRANTGDWVSRFTWKGDFRYRNEDIRQEFVATDRNRDRIRVRAGFVAKVNDTVTTEFQLTSSEPLSNGGQGDARSSNQTLTDANSRKRIFFDTAFAQWAPTATFKATFGKMRYPFVRPTGSLFFDNDINPEGIAFNWQQGTGGTPLGFFASAFYYQHAERSAAADSTMTGAQFGWRGDLASTTRLTLAASYFDNGAVLGWNAVQDATLPANAFGNTTTTSAAICRPGVITATSTACIANDFNIVEAMAELSVQLGAQPLIFAIDYAKNNDVAERPRHRLHGRSSVRPCDRRALVGAGVRLPAPRKRCAVRSVDRFRLRGRRDGLEGPRVQDRLRLRPQFPHQRHVLPERHEYRRSGDHCGRRPGERPQVPPPADRSERRVLIGKWPRGQVLSVVKIGQTAPTTTRARLRRLSSRALAFGDLRRTV
jgi:hypothetical protein